MEQSD